MASALEYREFAARCLEIARRTSDPQTQAVMLQMAQAWHRLAEELDQAVTAGSGKATDGADSDGAE